MEVTSFADRGRRLIVLFPLATAALIFIIGMISSYLPWSYLREQQETGFTVLYVTHDQEEALAISDRLVIMEAGEILADGTPDELREHPFLAPEAPSA